MKTKLLLLLSLVVFGIVGCGASSDGGTYVTDEIAIDGNQFLKDTPATYFLSGEDFNGTLNNVKLDENNIIILAENNTSGYFESKLISATAFKEAVASWNVNTSTSSSVTVSVQVGTDAKMSNWLAYGKWSANGNNTGHVNSSNDISSISYDTVSMSSGAIGTKFKIKVELKRDNSSVSSPKVRELMFSTTKIAKATDDYILPNIDFDVDKRSQMAINSSISSRICSPTSLSMIMHYQGVNQTPLEVAHDVQDGGGIYGNWSYNVAHAGEEGLRAYVRKVETIEELVSIVEKGIPVATSIRFGSITELEGAPINSTNGHLIVVRGFTSNGYVIVNDPASPTDATVRREYKVDQFRNVWNGYTYVVEAN